MLQIQQVLALLTVNQLNRQEESSVKLKKRKKMNLPMTRCGSGKKDSKSATTRVSLVLDPTTLSFVLKSPPSMCVACAGCCNTTTRY